MEEKNKYTCPYCGKEMAENKPNPDMSFNVLAVCPFCKFILIDKQEDEYD